MLRKRSCPAVSEVSAEVSGALNFTLCDSTKLHYGASHIFLSALADTSQNHTAGVSGVFPVFMIKILFHVTISLLIRL